MDVIETTKSVKDILKDIDPSKIEPVTFKFIDVAEDVWENMLKSHTEEESCRILNKKAA